MNATQIPRFLEILFPDLLEEGVNLRESRRMQDAVLRRVRDESTFAVAPFAYAGPVPTLDDILPVSEEMVDVLRECREVGLFADEPFAAVATAMISSSDPEIVSIGKQLYAVAGAGVFKDAAVVVARLETTRPACRITDNPAERVVINISVLKTGMVLQQIARGFAGLIQGN